MSLNDIADYMECSISSVTRYLNRGYKELREMLRVSQKSLGDLRDYPLFSQKNRERLSHRSPFLPYHRI